MGWCHRIRDLSSADFKTFFAQHSTHSGTPKCWFTEGVGWGGVGRGGEGRERTVFYLWSSHSLPSSTTFAHRVTFACMHARVYECIWITQGSWMGKWSDLSSLFPSPTPHTLHVMLTACTRVYKCTWDWLGSWKGERFINDWSSFLPSSTSITQHKLLSRSPWELEGEWSSKNMEISYPLLPLPSSTSVTPCAKPTLIHPRVYMNTSYTQDHLGSWKENGPQQIWKYLTLSSLSPPPPLLRLVPNLH